MPEIVILEQRTGTSVRRVLLGTAAALACAATAVYAAHDSLWINGRNGSGAAGNHLDFTYWGPDSAAAGVNKRSINWDGYNRIATTNGRIRDALDCYCTGGNWCYVAAHSAGDLQIGYARRSEPGRADQVGLPLRPVSRRCGSARPLHPGQLARRGVEAARRHGHLRTMSPPAGP